MVSFESLELDKTKIQPFYLNFRSSTNEDVVALDPVHSDYENLCGTRLEFRVRILKKYK